MLKRRLIKLEDRQNPSATRQEPTTRELARAMAAVLSAGQLSKSGPERELAKQIAGTLKEAIRSG